MSVVEELKKIEDDAQAVELWLFSHKKDVDTRRLEVYEILKKIEHIRERERSEYQSRGGRGKKEGKKTTTEENVGPREPRHDFYD